MRFPQIIDENPEYPDALITFDHEVDYRVHYYKIPFIFNFYFYIKTKVQNLIWACRKRIERSEIAKISPGFSDSTFSLDFPDDKFVHSYSKNEVDFFLYMQKFDWKFQPWFNKEGWELAEKLDQRDLPSLSK